MNNYCEVKLTQENDSMWTDFTRSTVLMKEAGATLPGDGVPVTRTLSVFRV